MRANVIAFPIRKDTGYVAEIFSVLKSLALHDPPMARSHAARLYLAGALNEHHYESIINDIHGD
jgi:hypothetical protein